MFIVYGLLNQKDNINNINITGISDQPVSIMDCGNLYAIVSPSNIQQVSQPSKNDLLAYHHVIDYFHKDHTIIPMRFGSTFEITTALSDYVAKNNESFIQVFNRISGCSEMGINVISIGPHKKDATNTKKYASGIDYLTKRKQHYHQIDQAIDDIRNIEKIISHEFKGMFLEMRKERKTPMTGKGLWSFYFLVKKENIQRFSETFNEIRLETHNKWMLSGPWPPFNFVTEEKKTQGLPLESLIQGGSYE